jgi:hypothetical protein
MARHSFIVKFPSNGDLEIFRRRIEATPEYQDLRVFFFNDPPDAIIKEIDSTRVARLKEVAGSSARFITDFVHDMF